MVVVVVAEHMVVHQVKVVKAEVEPEVQTV
jgi:hypothetical protein